MADSSDPTLAIGLPHDTECGAVGSFEDHRVGKRQVAVSDDPITGGREPLLEVHADSICAAHREMHIAQWSFPGTAIPGPVTGAVPAAVNPSCIAAERLSSAAGSP